jgi:phenylacetate-coenzyme A ligase PaaK-like adenylate-forming protein
VPDGEEGEVVFTTLTRTGMPLIRYRTGDLSHFLPQQCPCGSALKTLARITRRRDGAVRLGDGAELTMAELDEAVFSIEGVADFDVTLSRAPVRDRSNVRDRLTVRARVTGRGCGLPTQNLPAVVGRIPAIEQASRRGLLDVKFVVEPPSEMLPVPAKRRIEDVRDDA